MRVKRKTIITVSIIAIIAVAAVMKLMGSAPEAKVYTVKKGGINETIELRGKLDLEKKETVYAKLTGLIERTSASEGEAVSKSSVLAQLDVKDLSIMIKQASAAYEAALASLDKLRRSTSPEGIKLAQTQVEQTKIMVETAQKDFNLKSDKLGKIKTLYENGAVSKQELEDMQMLADSAEAVLKDSKQKYNMAIYSLQSLQKGSQANDLKQAEALAEQAKLQVEELRNNKGKAEIHPTIDGIITKKYIEKGETVQQGAPLFDIGNLSTAYIRVDVLSDDILKVKIGQEAIISGTILVDKKIIGEVYYIAPRAESSVSSLGVEQQRVEVKIRFDNSNYNFKPGYAVDVDIVTSGKESALFVPEKAIFDMNGTDSAFIVSNGKIELRSIQTGIKSQDYIEVVKGIQENEKVIVDPANTLKPGSKIKETKY